MNWKKIVLFILFLVVGILGFGISTVIVSSVFSILFFIAYVILLILILKKYSKRKMVIISLILFSYLMIMIIPFPACSSWGFFSQKTKDCTCIGIEKHIYAMDASWSQCVGIPINYVCHRWDMKTGIKEEISCD